VDDQRELAAEVPSDNTAIARRYRESIATSALDIRRGEAIYLDSHGRALGRAPYERLIMMARVGIYGALIGSAVLVISGAWIPGIALYAAGITPSLWSSYRGMPKLMAVELLMRQGELDEAQRRLDAVPQLRRRNPIFYPYLAGLLASHRGDHITALARWREALPRTKRLLRERIKIMIIHALILSGQLREAKLTLETLELPPTVDEVLIGHTFTRVMLALHDPSEMPPIDTLHDWARQALAYSHTGHELAAIGWAFDRAGEDDMAQLLATEAIDRMHYPYLATWWPALQQWLDARTSKPAEPPPA
jgi:hypothetical protein